MTKTMSTWIVALVGCSGIAATVIAAAPSETEGLTEIIVTATKTGNLSAQSAPFAIQAVGEDQMARDQMQGFDDYSKTIAGLAALNKGPDQTQIIIRGITAGRVSHAEPQNGSTSGLYLDETPVAANGFNPDIDLFDVNRLEVLKGPQGTLFGSGAMSGAIRLITNEVDLHGTGGVASIDGAAIDHGSADYGAHGVINVPIIDDVLGVRASAYYDHGGGYIKNVYDDRSDYNDYNKSGGRLKAQWDATDSLVVKASVLYQKLDASGRPQMFMPGDSAVTAFSPGVPVAAPGENLLITGDYQTAKFTPDPFTDKLALTNVLVEESLGSLKLVSSTSYFNRQIDNLLDDTYRTRLHFGATEVDGVTPLISPFPNDTDINDVSQEFRVSQKRDNGLTWVTGVYFENHAIHYVSSVPTPGMDALAISFGLPPASGFGAMPNSEFDGNEVDTQKQYAVFGETTIPLASKWELIAGLRWFHYKQDSYLRYAGIANDGVTEKDASLSESGSTPKVELAYHPINEAMIYAQAAKGFRLGGVTEPVPTAGVFGTNCGADLAAVGLTSLPNTFKSDSLWSYELGLKSSWLEHRLTFNAAIFDIEWKDIQTNVFLPCGFITVVNAGKVRSKGGEVELAYAPLQGLTLTATAGYTDATLRDKSTGFAAEIGDRVPNVPKLTAAGSSEYRWPATGVDRSWFVRASIAYVGNSYTEFESLINAKEVPSSTSLDAGLGYAVGPWEASLYGKNLANRLIVTGVDTDRNTPTTYTVAPPRTIGIEARVKF